MNYSRLALAAVAATIVDAVYGFLVYGTLLANQFAQFPNVYRPPSDTTHMPVLFAGTLVAALAASYIYAKGYEGRSGVEEGLRFGVVVGVFAIGYSSMVNYAVLNINLRLGVAMAAAALVEWIVAGIVIGLVYKPLAAPAARKAVGV